MATDSITTVARPYAKAAFEAALNDNALEKWSSMLTLLATLSLDERVASLARMPGKTAAEVADIFIAIGGSHLDAQAVNFVRLLAESQRLLVLSEIKAIFEHLKAEQEKSVEVEVLAFDTMNEAQQQSLAQSLTKRLQREVSLKVSLDKSILGGAIIRAGDLVIDGSVRGKLEKLSGDLRI